MNPPVVSVTLNAVPDDMNDLMVVPPSGFAINVSVTPADHPIDPNLFWIWATRWGEVQDRLLVIENAPDGLSAAGLVGNTLPTGSYTLLVLAGDTEGNLGETTIDIAVRDHPPTGPAIASGQQVWLDFLSDRDAVPGPDFAVDLEHFGLGSPAEPSLSETVEGWLVARTVQRVSDVYHGQDPNGLGAPDPIQVSFLSADPGSGDVTRICVGGEDPGGGITIGSVQIDVGNLSRNSTHCDSLPPTGIFPRELLIFDSDATFQQIFDPLRAEAGGTPVGEHALDPTVLDAAFVPASAGAEQLARWDEIQLAIGAFSDALGSVIAHETGHALGVTAPGAPGGGLFGGAIGPDLGHNLTAGGSTPTQSWIMNAGSTYSFPKLAGLGGNPLPVFRPLNFAYLRDRALIDGAVTGLFFPPAVVSVSPSLAPVGPAVILVVQGTRFQPTPSIRLESPGFNYEVLSEGFDSATQITGIVVTLQTVPAVYDLVVTNPDGQTAVLENALTIQ